MPSRRRAFTLVELLVVLGILTALIAILLPVAARARAHAVRLKCAANLRTIGQGLTMYVQRYGCYPLCRPSAYRPFASWPVQIRDFLGGNEDVFFCPAQDQRCQWKKDRGGLAWRASDPEMRFGYDRGELVLNFYSTFFSYGYNLSGTGEDWAAGRGLGASADLPGDNILGDRPVRANQVKTPSEMIAIADTIADGVDDLGITPAPDYKTFMWPGEVHSRGANVLFCDGHVQWYLQKDLTFELWPDPLRARVARMWNNDNVDLHPHRAN